MYYGYVKEYIDSYEDTGAPTIFWLDYDYSIECSMLDDCKKLVNKMKSGDIFFVSFNSMIAHRRKKDSLADYYKSLSNRFSKILQELGDYAPTRKVMPTELIDSSKRDKVFVDIFKNMIETQISTRNNGGKKYKFFQLAFFSYSDGADMVTWGGMLVDGADEQKLRKLLQGNSHSLPFLSGIDLTEKGDGVISEDVEPFDLRIPLLTYREFIALQKEFPTDEISSIDVAGFNENELRQLNKLYRYYSPYLEAGIFN